MIIYIFIGIIFALITRPYVGIFVEWQYRDKPKPMGKNDEVLFKKVFKVITSCKTVDQHFFAGRYMLMANIDCEYYRDMLAGIYQRQFKKNNRRIEIN